MSAGALNVGSWVAIGREGGTGVVNMSGGTITKNNGGSNFIVGASGPGTLNMSNGSLVDVVGGITWIGESNNASANLSLADTAEFRTSEIVLARDNGTTATVTMSGASLLNVASGVTRVGQAGTSSLTLATASTVEVRTTQVLIGVAGTGNGTVNLNGGTLKTGLIDGGDGAANATFNGTQIIATATALPFISDLDTAVIDAGGLKVDSAGFNLTSAQVFTGAGGVTKSGAGVLTLTGASTYTGDHVVNGGALNLTTATSSAGALTVAGNATLGVKVLSLDAGLVPSSVTLSTADPKTLNIDLGSFGNPLSTGAPISTTGALDVSGVTTFNITATGLTVGQFPLISYGSKTGSGSFQIGTLPPGVVATIVDSGTSIDLNITSASSYEWEGSVAGQVWDVNTTANWYNAVTASPAQVYVDGGLVTFNNIAVGFDPVLNVAVAPSSVVFDNNATSPYTLTGTGSIGGTGGVTKRGEGNVTIGLANSYTGATVLEGGTLTVNTLPNGGVASPVGASSSSPNNLAFAGGTLAYTGVATTTDRGFTIAASESTILSGLSTSNDLTISGQLTVATVGRFMKSGAGVLTLTNPGANVLALTGDADATPGYAIAEGGLALVGGGTQTNTMNGQFRVGTVATNTTTLTLDNSTLTVNGPSLSSMAADTTSTITIGGTSVYQANGRFNMGHEANSVSNVIIKDSGTLNKVAGWLSVGNSSNATGFMTVKDNGVVNNSNGDFNVSDVDTSKGTLTIEGSGTVNSSSPMYIGKNGGTTGTLNLSSGTLNVTSNFYLARQATSTGTATQTGGSSTMGGTGEVFIGADGAGTYTLSGGTMAINGWLAMGRYASGVGVLNVSGGTLTQNSTDRNFMVGEEGNGTLNVSDTGVVDARGFFSIGQAATGTGVVNLDGGKLMVNQVDSGNTQSISTFNFNGGELEAKRNEANFFRNIDTVEIKAGGAIIDSNGFDIVAAQAFDGEGNLTKLGAGKLTMQAFHGYTGDTIVSAGTLSLSQDYLDNASDVVIETGATLELTHSKTDVVTSLSINGASVTGEWGAIGSGAQNESASITGSGRLRVGAALPYIDWAETKTLDNSNNGLELDPDGDGIANLLEYFLDGDPLFSDSVVLPSAADSTATDFVLKFKRRDDANADVTVQEFQYSSDLQSWTDLPIPTTAGTTTVGPVTITVAANGADPDDITVTIPKGANTKMFGRISTED
jgi:autotransporter-associated beta strand protein/T5SS/PEP-CTERM-associated repeat protein